MVFFMTKRCRGWIEQSDNGCCEFSFFEKRATFSTDLDFSISKILMRHAETYRKTDFPLYILDPIVLSNKRLYRDRIPEFKQFPRSRFLVYSVSDYDGIFEPLIEKVLEYDRALEENE
jgi:hypothetical protein